MGKGRSGRIANGKFGSIEGEFVVKEAE